MNERLMEVRLFMMKNKIKVNDLAADLKVARTMISGIFNESYRSRYLEQKIIDWCIEKRKK